MLKGKMRFLTAIIFLVSAFASVSEAQVCQPAPVGLVSWYSADGNALDSRSRNNGTLNGGADFAAGKVGQGFNFDGTNDFVTFGDPANLKFTNTDFTIEGWFMTPDVPNNPGTQCGARYPIFGYDAGYTVEIGGDGRLRFRKFVNANDSVSLDSLNPVSINTFHHFAAIHTLTEMRLYVDGVLVNTLPISNGTIFYPVTDTPEMGHFNCGVSGPGQVIDYFFKGQIDETSIYNRALTDTEIAAIFNAGTAGKCKPTATVAPSGQVAWFAGDGNANDIDGTNNGAFTGTSSFSIGKVGQQFNFDGTQSVDVPDNASLDFTNAFTLEMWVNPSALGTLGSAFISKGFLGASNSQSYSILFDTAGTVFNRVGNGSTIDQVNSTTQLPLNTYTHIATSYDGGTLRIYINGVLNNSKTTTIGTLLNSSNPLQIGRGTSFVQAGIDEVSLYNRSLTDAEITSIFNAGIAGKLKTATTPTGFSIADSGLRNADLKNNVADVSPQVVNTTIGDATVTFPTVTTAGTTQEIPLSLTGLPALPLSVTPTGLAYDIATSAVFTGSPTLCFNLPSLVAQFGFLRILHLENGVWVNRTTTTSTSPNLCSTALSSLSPFAIVNGLSPTAATVSVSGRVITGKNNGLTNARVTLIDLQGNMRTALTGGLGYYRFDEIAVGETYILSVQSKRYTVASQAIFVTEEMDGVDFTASP